MGGSGGHGGTDKFPGTDGASILETIVRRARNFDRPICIDTACLIAFLSDEEPYSSLVRILLDPARGHRLVFSIISLSEIFVLPAREGGSEAVHALATELGRFWQMSVMSFDRDHAETTAMVRAATGLKLPDAAVIATAYLANASAIVGNDKQWRNKQLDVPYVHLDDLL